MSSWKLKNPSDACESDTSAQIRNGNKFYENHSEFPLRHRWVDYAADNEFNASQVDPLWHSWLHHIRQLPPHEDKGIQKMTQTWMTTPRENITGTRGAFKTYNTTKPKIVSAAKPPFPHICGERPGVIVLHIAIRRILTKSLHFRFATIAVRMGAKGRPEGIDL